jgi:MFS family permease
MRRRPYLFFALAGVSLLMFSIDSTVVSVALPNMQADLQTSLVWLSWTLTTVPLTFMIPDSARARRLKAMVQPSPPALSQR